MKKHAKWISVLLILALAAGLFGGMTVWAEGEDEGDPAAPADTTLPGQGQQGDELSSAGNTVKTQTGGDADTTPPQGSVELISYEVSPSYIEKGEYFSLSLIILDNRIKGKTDDELKGAFATVNGEAFTFRSADAKTDTATGRVEVKFGDVLYVGGTPNMTIEISYPESNVPIGKVNLTLTQCVDTPDPTPTPEPAATPEPTYKTPGIIIKQSSFGDAPQVQAGSEFTLTLTVFTTTGTENLSDVLVTLSLPKDVSLATGNLNTYIGEMGPEATRTVTYQILPSATFVDGVANIGIEMSGKGQNSGAGASGTTSISVPVVQPERFEITNIEAPETMMLGEEGYVSLTFVNKGKTPISNLQAEIRGDNLANPGQSQFLGNIAAGTENSVDFNVMASQAGTINATIVLSYEDDAGNVKTLEKTFSCTVEEMPMYDDPGMMDPGMMDPAMGDDEPKGGLPWWGWVLILLAVGGGAAAAVIVLKKRKAKQALAQLEDQDEDL